MSCRLGIVCRADNGGLGSQTWELYNNLKPTKTLVIDISGHNQQHGQLGYDNHPERYTRGQVLWSINFPSEQIIDEFLDGIDVLLTVESPYSYYLFEEARRRGVKSVLQMNYEFLDYFVHPDWAKPDLFLAPSMWNLDKLPGWGVPTKFIPVPINRERFPFKQRTQARTFLHIAGHSTYEDRNGTLTVLQAMQYVKDTNVKLTVRSQYALPEINDYRINVQYKDLLNYWELYNDEDVLLLPRKYGGLSLQLMEAMSTGMIPVMLDIPPQNGFLHAGSLIPATFEKTVAPRGPIDVYNCTPQQLAAKIDQLAVTDTSNIQELSDFSNVYAESISWDNLAGIYTEAIEQCLLR